MKSIGLIFPHQLFAQHKMYGLCEELYVIEEHLFFRQFNFHKAKIAYHKASMLAFVHELQKEKKAVHHIESHCKQADVRTFLSELQKEEIGQIHYIDPTDDWLHRRINKVLSNFEGEVMVHDNPLFLNTPNELSTFFKPEKKSFFQTTFYKQERKQRKLLMDASGEPQGGKWTYDAENRKKYPKNSKPPTIAHPKADEFWTKACAYVDEHFEVNPGEIYSQPFYPYRRKEALQWMDQFFEDRFTHFGDYEDAIVKEEVFLHHAVLTPMLNIGLIQPTEVIDACLHAAQKYSIPINSLEGFIRQIIGWREFIRGMYEAKGGIMRTQNFWGFKRKIPKSFYTGETGIPPVDDSIKKVLKFGYCHHIERLMVLGNFMLLCEFDPDEVYRWFMELFIDAYDWVMVPNVYGMSQFADGGLFATKPYISGSNYILKMSNYKKGEWQKSWDGLFWHFMDKQRAFFLKNPRLSMLVRSFDKMHTDKKEAHLKAAQSFFERLDSA